MNDNFPPGYQTSEREDSDVTRQGDARGIVPVLTKTVIKHDQEISKQSESIDKLNEIVANFKDEVERLKEKLEKKIDDSRIRVVETLGIFVALFTFISIDFQVYRSYRHPLSISGLTLILLGSLLSIIILLDYFVIRNNNPDEPHKKSIRHLDLFLFSFLFIIIGIVLFILSPYEK